MFIDFYNAENIHVKNHIIEKNCILYTSSKVVQYDLGTNIFATNGDNALPTKKAAANLFACMPTGKGTN